MHWFTTLFEQMGDALKNHTTAYVYLISMFTLLWLMWHDLRKFKTNQLSRQVTSRIGKEEKDSKFEITDIITKFSSKIEEKAELELEKANVLFTVKEYLTFMATGLIIGVIIGFLIFPLGGLWKAFIFFASSEASKSFFGRLLAGSLFGFAGSMFPKFWLMYLTFKRKKLMSDQIQDALLNIADALKSGHVIQDAIKIVGQEMPFPIGPEFARAYQEMETGKSLNVALTDLKKRVDLKDFTMAINAIEIQFDVGGKLEPLLRNMTKIIQERQELKKEIEKTIAQSKMTGIVLLSFPVFFVVVFSMLNKEAFVDMMHSTVGIILLITAFVCYVAAAWIIIWIIRDVSKEA